MSNLILIFYNFTHTIGYPNYGLAIILFTAVLRVLMFPLSLSQAKNSKAMALLQPRIKKLQEQYKNDPGIMNREVQSLYKKYKVSPLTGCLPLLIQMPILISLFSAMRNFEYTGEGISFLWLPSMSDPDPTGLALPAIVALSSFLQSKLTMASQPSMGDQAAMMNKTMLYFMPLMLGWMTRGFAAGLALYWSTFNILGFLMQIVINARVNASQEYMKEQVEADEKRAADEARKEESRRRREAARLKQEKKSNAQQARVKVKKSSNLNSNRGKALNFDDMDDSSDMDYEDDFDD